MPIITRCLKSIVLITVLLCCRVKVHADYGYMSLSKLLIEAKNCAVGTIVYLDTNYFYLRTDSLIFGEVKADTLKIMRFEDWPCGMRYDKYKVGQKEVVCYKKSNEVIEDYDLLGYGGGCESEMPIVADSIVRYEYAYNKFLDFEFSSFIAAVKDYKKLIEECSVSNRRLTKEDVQHFGNKSEVHKLLIEKNDFKPRKRYDDDKVKSIGSIRNIETNYLYDNFENKLAVTIPNEKFEDLIMEVDEAIVRKEQNYFVVKPIDGWARRWIYVVKLIGRDTVTLTSDIFDVYPIPEPSIYVRESAKDSLSVLDMRYGIPNVKYGLGDWHTNDYLEYVVLKFDVDIKHRNALTTINCKNARGNRILRQAMKNIKVGDTVKYYNLWVQYPDGKIKKIKDKTVYIVREKY